MTSSLQPLIEVEEYDIKLKVDSNVKRDKARAFYNASLKMNRAVVSTALASYIRSGLSVFKPIHCLDAVAGCGIHGITWKKYLRDSVEVTINATSSESFDIVQKNVECNNISNLEILNQDPCILLHSRPFNFIYMDCHTSAAQYFDSIFRFLTKNGILVITTSDDSSLYWQYPLNPLRNYGGFIVKTSYQKELSIRLVIAAMARSAAKYNKGLRVLYCATYKSQQSFTIIVSVEKGSAATTDCLNNIRKLLFCSVCEEKVFVPVSNFVHEEPLALLGCHCAGNSPGKTVYELGPVWSGNIFSSKFISTILVEARNFPWGKDMALYLNLILTEARCSKEINKPTIKRPISEVNGNTDTSKNKKQKVGSTEEPSEEIVIEKHEPCDNFLEPDDTNVPPFYYNRHRYSPKTFKLLKINKVIEGLKQEGYRASRTHFDSDAIRTDATTKQLQKVCEKLSKPG